MLTPFSWKAVAKFRNPFILPAVYSLENSKYITEAPNVTGSTKAKKHAEDNNLRTIAQVGQENFLVGDQDTDENPSSRITQQRKKLDVPGKTGTIAKGGLIRHTRSNNSTCIKRYDYRIIYNHFFRIPICKRHKKCQRMVRIVRFFNGVTKAINYSCVRVDHWGDYKSSKCRLHNNQRTLKDKPEAQHLGSRLELTSFPWSWVENW